MYVQNDESENGERKSVMWRRGRGREEKERRRPRDLREVIYRKLPRSPESHYKHWAIACMRPTSCAAKEHVNPMRAKEPKAASYLYDREGGKKTSSEEKRRWRVLCSPAVIGSRCRAEIFTSDFARSVIVIDILFI